MTTLHFAQISDIHFSVLGDQYDMLSSQAADFLATIVTNLNQIEDLDFVLITGDLFVTAQQQELDQFQQAIQALHKPYYIVPGNHDHRSPNSSQGLTRRQFARHFNPQFKARPTGPGAQPGYWSITVKPDIQLIGLDSNLDEDWGGIIDVPQIEWLKSELATHADKLIVLAVHHPFHALAPIDQHPDWSKFVCHNGPEILTLLDEHPQVKIVLTGHHHLAKVDTLGRRLHLACPAVTIYPCAYRTLRLSRQPDRRWRIEWQTHPATDEAAIAEARRRMVKGWTEAGFEADFVAAYARLAWGDKQDREGKAIL